MSILRLFFDAFSQPSRAILLLLESNKVQYQPCLINIAKAEHITNEEFVKVSPNKTVPAIDDNGFHLFESAAILKYLVAKYSLPDHWYPKDITRRAKIDEYLSWHTANLRLGAAGFMFNKFIFPRMMGAEPDEKKIQEAEGMLQKSIRMFEKHFLKESKFINSSEISIADIQAACEFTQFWLADIDQLGDKPLLQTWFKNVQSELNPAFDEVHKMVYLAREKGVFKSKM